MTQKEKREYVEGILEEPHSLDPRTVEVLEEYLSTLDRQWVSVDERLPELSFAEYNRIEVHGGT